MITLRAAMVLPGTTCVVMIHAAMVFPGATCVVTIHAAMVLPGTTCVVIIHTAMEFMTIMRTGTVRIIKAAQHRTHVRGMYNLEILGHKQ